jgi:hypothetical protein
MISPIHATALAAECEHFSSAFSDIEGEICDLTRMARLAALQLHEAVGELPIVNGEYTEAPNVEATDLAIFAVSQMAVMAKRLEELYYRLHNEAVAAGTLSLAAQLSSYRSARRRVFL